MTLNRVLHHNNTKDWFFTFSSKYKEVHIYTLKFVCLSSVYIGFVMNFIYTYFVMYVISY